MNPSDRHHGKRLQRAVEFSRERLRPFRAKRLERLREYVGQHHSEGGLGYANPVNLLELAVSIYSRALIAGEPAVSITTPHLALKGSAENLELATNFLMKHIGLRDALEDAVMDAIFGVGLMKVGIAEPDPWFPGRIGGQPFADPIDIDDWVHDTSAKRWEQVSFMGDRYRVPLDWAKDNPAFHPGARDKLSADEKGYFTDEGDETADSITAGHVGGDPDEYEEKVELQDIWLPRERVLRTYHLRGDWDRPLAVREWDGPPRGPYHRIAFGRIPSNSMPLAPASVWMDLHLLANQIWRKLARQSARQKTIYGVQRGGADDGDRIVKSNDGDTIGLDDPRNVAELRFGGVDPPELAFALAAMERFNYHAGNLDALGGLSPQADTLGQEEMLTQAAGQRLAAMRDRVYAFTKGIAADIAWWIFNDVDLELPLTKRVPGTDIEIPSVVTRDRLGTDYLAYNYDLAVHALKDQNPEARFGKTLEIIERVVLPMLPAAEAQGLTISLPELLRIAAKARNTPELLDIVQRVQGGGAGGAGGVWGGATRPGPVGEAPRKSPVSRREYVRRSVPAPSRRGSEAMLAQMMAASGGRGSSNGGGRPAGAAP